MISLAARPGIRPCQDWGVRVVYRPAYILKATRRTDHEPIRKPIQKIVGKSDGMFYEVLPLMTKASVWSECVKDSEVSP